MNGLDLLQEAKRRFIAELESRDCGCKYLNAEVIVSSQLNAREVLGRGCGSLKNVSEFRSRRYKISAVVGKVSC